MLPFGSGVLPVSAPHRVHRRLERGNTWVGPGEDIQSAARRIVENGLGRTVLGGQLPGQIGLVGCHPLAFSRLTAAILELLEGPEEPSGPLFEDPAVARELAGLRDLGLDEGAVLIHERPFGRGPRGSPSEPSGGSLGRLVFTNVEPTMRLVGQARPVPMLLLMRGQVPGELASRAPRGSEPGPAGTR